MEPSADLLALCTLKCLGDTLDRVVVQFFQCCQMGRGWLEAVTLERFFRITLKLVPQSRLVQNLCTRSSKVIFAPPSRISFEPFKYCREFFETPKPLGNLCNFRLHYSLPLLEVFDKCRAAELMR